MFYQDTMDSTRLVKIDSSVKNQAKVSVFFKDKDLTKDPAFCGKTELPLSLFSGDPRNRYIGFVPWNRDAELERLRQEKAWQEELKLLSKRDSSGDDW